MIMMIKLIVLSVLAATGLACEEGKIYKDPSSCENYIQCDHGKELIRSCPPGLYFNPSATTCDWPQNVNCKGDETTSAASSGTTTVIPISTTDIPDDSVTTSSEKPTTKPPSTVAPAPTTPGMKPPPSNKHQILFAPYFDVNMKGPSLPQVYAKTGQKYFTLAFALGSNKGCYPMWGGQSEIDDPSIIGPIRQIQAAGGQFIVATGGAMGPYFENLCSNVDDLANAYKIVMDAVGTNHVDVDVESTVDADRMNKALAKVQRERPNTTVSYTLMVQAEDYGLTPALGVDILRNAKSNGVQVTIVNPMTMEFGGPSPDFGDSVIGAAKSVLQQMKQIWPEKSPQELNKMLGVTPMLGKNFNGKIFRLDHARKLVRWANDNHIGLLAFWSVGRDNGNCAGGGISPSCSSIAQNEYEFTKIFQDFTG